MARFWRVWGAFLVLALPPAAAVARSTAPIPAVPARVENDPRAAYRCEHLDLALTLFPQLREIRGEETLVLTATDLLQTVVLDLTGTLEVDSAWTRTAELEVERPNAEQIALTLPVLHAEGERDTLYLRYHGRPGAHFLYPQEPPSPLLANSTDLPGEAHSWWPCKDVTGERLTTHLRLTSPPDITFLAAGRLISRRENGDGSVTWEYGSELPVPPFQLAVCAAAFKTWSVLYHSDLADRDLPIEFYALAEDTARARDRWSLLATPDSGILARLEFILGPLPELQSAADAGRGEGAARRRDAEPLRICALDCPSQSGQGLLRLDWCSLPDSAAARRDLVEQLTHQWYGACMSPARPRDLWIDRAVASYAAALVAERFDGWAGYLAQMEYLHRDQFLWPVVPADVTWSVDTTGTVVENMSAKGAWMLHMLRWVLRNRVAIGSGRPVEPALLTPPELADAAFLGILRSLGGTEAYRWSTFTTEDFVRFWEESVPLDLHWFFAPWLFGTGRPRLVYDWTAAAEAESTKVHLHLEQVQEDPVYPNGEPYLASPRFFPTLWPVRLLGPRGEFTELVVHQTARDQDFTLAAVHAVSRVLIDPDHWLLRDLTPLAPASRPLELLQVKPNPTFASAEITFRISQAGATEATVHDVQGRLVRRLMGKSLAAGTYLLTWDGRRDDGLPAPAGVYFVRLHQAGSAEARKIVLLGR